jgi:PAS domain S-box-containing protein
MKAVLVAALSSVFLMVANLTMSAVAIALGILAAASLHRAASIWESQRLASWRRLIGSGSATNWNNRRFDRSMLNLGWIWEPRNRTVVVLTSVSIVLAIALVQWWMKPHISLGFLYLFPIMLAAGFLPRWGIALMGIACALLSACLSNLGPADATLRSSFEAVALVGSGLFISEVLRNRLLRQTSREQLRVLVETSPAAIVTVDEHGFIELANRAAAELMAPRDGDLIRQPIAAFLPELHHTLCREEGPQIKTPMQCWGHRGNGKPFLADVWFSSYKEGPTFKLAAIIADVTEKRSGFVQPNPVGSNHQRRPPLNNRESNVLRLLVEGLANRSIAVRLNLSENSVKSTLHHMYVKTDVRNRSQLVRLALERYRDLL